MLTDMQVEVGGEYERVYKPTLQRMALNGQSIDQAWLEGLGSAGSTMTIIEPGTIFDGEGGTKAEASFDLSFVNVKVELEVED